MEDEILKNGKPLRPRGNGGLTVLLAVGAVWAAAFVMGLRLRHPLPRVILAVLAAALSWAIVKANKKEE